MIEPVEAFGAELYELLLRDPEDLNSAIFQFWNPTLLKLTELRFWFGSVPLASLVAQLHCWWLA